MISLSIAIRGGIQQRSDELHNYRENHIDIPLKRAFQTNI